MKNSASRSSPTTGAPPPHPTHTRSTHPHLHVRALAKHRLSNSKALPRLIDVMTHWPWTNKSACLRRSPDHQRPHGLGDRGRSVQHDRPGQRHPIRGEQVGTRSTHRTRHAHHTTQRQSGRVESRLARHTHTRHATAVHHTHAKRTAQRRGPVRGEASPGCSL